MKQAIDKTARTRFQTWLHQTDWITYPDVKKDTEESRIAEQKRRERMATTEHQTPETKKCFTCGRELPASDFGIHRASKDGLNYSCKECTCAKQKEYREAVKAARARAKKKADAAKKATEDTKKKIEPFESPEMKSGTLVEIPSRGWFRAFTDDDLYGELVARGWRGTLTKSLNAE